MKKLNIKFIVIVLLFVLIVYNLIFDKEEDNYLFGFNEDKVFSILSSNANSYLEDEIRKYAKDNKIDVKFTYMGDLDIVTELNHNSSSYDAVWISNSMWLYTLDNQYLTSNSKSISISPVVFGIKKNKANELELINKNITNNDILTLIQNKSIKYVMSSVTQTNTGATAYFGFLDTLAGNPEVLTEEMLNDEILINKMIDIFSGVERVSGDEDYLEKMFLNSDDYEAVIADEASLININKSLEKQGKEPLYLLYPIDGVAVNDSTFAFINNNIKKEDDFLKIQNYLLSDEGQKMLENSGLRTWYGGVNDKSNPEVFDKSWGIDTTKYLNVTKFPSKNIMTLALNIYIERLRKPTHVIFCLDYSGSMYGNGINELTNAMEYILDYDKASVDKLQFSEKDKITIVPFSTSVIDIWQTESGYDTLELRNKINHLDSVGSTALYDAIIESISILENETDDYTKTIIAMTDGNINVGSYIQLSDYYYSKNSDIPVYSITFGSAVESQLEQIANLTNAKVFNGKSDLLKAFKEVRGYN